MKNLKVGLSNNFWVKGEEMTCGAKILENFFPVYDASIVETLKKSGATLVPNLKYGEFGLGDKSKFDCANQINQKKCDVVVCSDSKGELRNDAINNNLIGLKTTYTLVSRNGLAAMGSSFDTIGVVGKDVNTIAKTLKTISFYDSKDGVSFKGERADYTKVDNATKAKKFAVLGDSSLTKDFSDTLVKNGGTIKAVDFKNLEFVEPSLYAIYSAESSSNLARLDGINFGKRVNDEDYNKIYDKSRTAGFNDDTKNIIMLGNLVLIHENFDKYYTNSAKVRRVIKNELDSIFKENDYIITPATSDYIYLASLCGNPAIVFNVGGKPVQVIAKNFDEKGLLSLI